MAEIGKNSRNNNIILNTIGILSLCLILCLNINVFYWADDYSILNEINDFGILRRCVEGYYTWDGRYMTPAAFFQGLFLSELPVGLITLIWNVCFLVGASLLYFIAAEEKLIDKSNRSIIYLPLLFAIAYWLGSYGHIAQTIYWATGGVYSFNLLLGGFWLLGFYKMQNCQVFLHKVLFLLATIIIGITTQNLTVGLMTLLFLTIFQNALKNENHNLAFNTVLFLIILIGTVFLSTAPGNFIRMKEINAAALTDISLWLLVKNFIYILYAYLKITVILAFLAVSVGIVCLSEKGEKFSVVFRKIILVPKSKVQLITFIDHYKYLLVALSTILPLITIPEVGSGRTAIYFMFFLFLFIVRFVTLFGSSSTKIGLSVFLPYTVFLLAICFTAYNFQKGTTLKSEITKRENLLKNSENKIIKVSLIDESLKSHCYDFRDFRGNDDWALEAQRDYFGIRKIFVE